MAKKKEITFSFDKFLDKFEKEIEGLPTYIIDKYGNIRFVLLQSVLDKIKEWRRDA